MEIELQEARWAYMYSYGDNNILKLNKDRISQLNAINGSGKTSIALIIQEILCSKNVKALKKEEILNTHAPSKLWWAELDFANKDTNKQYFIRVERAGVKSTVILKENGIDISEHKVPDTYKKIKEIIGIETNTLFQLMYQSSVNTLEFLKATDSNRKKFLISLFNLQKYLDAGEIIKLRINESEKELNMLAGELRAVEDFLNNTNIEEKRKEIKVPEIDTSLEEQEKQFSSEILNFESQCKAIDKNNLLISEQSESVFDMAMPEPNISLRDLRKDELGKVSSEILNLETEIKNIEQKIKKLDLSDTCYACGQSIDNSISIKMKNEEEAILVEKRSRISKLITHKVTIQEEITELNKYIKEFEENKKAIERFEQLAQLIDPELPVKHPDYSNLEEELHSITKKIKEQRKAREDAINYNATVSSHNTKIDTLINQKREFLARQELLNSDIINLKNKINKRNIIKKAFSPSGIPAFKLENLTKELEDSINEYLSELSDGRFQIIFRLTGDKLNVVVVDQGKEVSIHRPSSGEFGRIQIAILLAIRAVLSKLGGNTVNLLFLDEIDGVLDADGKEKLIEVLQEEHNTNVFLISHSFTHPLLQQIEIVKEDNISKLVT